MSPRRILVEQLEQRRLLSAGDLDPFFGDHGAASIVLNGELPDASMTIQADGKMVAAAPVYLRARVTYQLELIRFLPSGDVDESFGENGVVILPRAFAGAPEQ